MSGEMLMAQAGMAVSLLFFLLLTLFLQHKKSLLWPISSLSFLLAFLVTTYINPIFLSANAGLTLNSGLLLLSIMVAFFGGLLYWRLMLNNPFGYIYHWFALMLSLLLLVFNQVVFKTLSLFTIPALVFGMAGVVELLLEYHRKLKYAVELELRTHKKNMAIGWDLATGLSNKLAFSDTLDNWLLINPDKKLNVIVFKLTQFELLNRLVGHNNSDLVKTQLISRMKRLLLNDPALLQLSANTEAARVATLGGVDFVIAVTDYEAKQVTERLVKQLYEKINEPLMIDATVVDVGIQFGVASYPEQGLNSSELIENAYVALHAQSNNSTKNIYFEAPLEQEGRARRLLLAQLHQDLSDNKFELYVQPQIKLSSNAVIGGEVLIRWRRDDGYICEATNFIQLAEESGLIYSLNLWTLKQSIKQLAQLKRAGFEGSLAINLSNKELFQPELVETITNNLEKYHVAAERLVIEIKESAYELNQSRDQDICTLLQKLEVKIALDDFGKAQSLLFSFNHFKPHYVKVDCKSLNSMSPSKQDNTYVNAIIGMMQSLNIKVVAQGVETNRAKSQLLDIQCDYAQGYLFSKPFELTSFDDWLSQRKG